MALRLTKKSKVIFAISIVILSGALGYLIWRVNQKDTTAPQDSEAGENSCNCCDTLGDGSIPTCATHQGTDIPCSCTYKAGACGGGIPQCVVSECTEGSECNLNCIWPQVNFCNRVSNGKCECRGGDTNRCTGPDPNCKEENLKCPTGYTECTSNCGSDYKTISCTGRCTGCNNKYTAQIKCKKNAVTPVCGDGIKNGTEECDPKASPTGCKTGYSCSSKCKCVLDPYCGDKVVGTGEECDPPNDPCTKDGHSGKCSSTCKCVLNPYCGDKVIGTGEECDPPNNPCTKDGHSGKCSSTCKCAVNPYCGDGQLKDDEECEVGDPAGVKCAWSSCNQSACICLLPGLSISKTVVKQCTDEGSENPKSELLYTITVNNTGTGLGQISKIEDTLDTKIVTAGIVPTDITEGGSYLGGKITWLFSSPLTISPGETKVYSYKMMVDKSHFGAYANTVVLTPVSGEPIQATATINADCIITVPTVPQTGIFDSTVGRIAGGFGLIALGGFVYSMPSRVFLLNRQSDERRRNKYRVKFESKIFKK